MTTCHVKPRGSGKTHPVAHTDSDEHRAKNRGIEIRKLRCQNEWLHHRSHERQRNVAASGLLGHNSLTWKYRSERCSQFYSDWTIAVISKGRKVACYPLEGERSTRGDVNARIQSHSVPRCRHALCHHPDVCCFGGSGSRRIARALRDSRTLTTPHSFQWPAQKAVRFLHFPPAAYPGRP